MCIVDVIIPNLVHVLFDPAIPTSSFNLFNYFFIFVIISSQAWSFDVHKKEGQLVD